MKRYLIEKNGKFTKDYEPGKLTIRIQLAEVFTSKKSAEIKAREYGRTFGKGYRVVEF